MRVSGKWTSQDTEQLALFGKWLKRVAELDKAGVKDARRQACKEVYGDANCEGCKE